MLHTVFHVIALVAFLGAVAIAFLGFIAPLMGPDSQLGLPPRHTALAVAFAAALGLAADWLGHQLG